MNVKLRSFLKTVDKKFLEQFGFHVKDVSISKVADYLYTPKHSASLAVTRILFGLTMLFDIPDERGGAALDRRWSEHVCHFPLLPLIRAMPLPYMALVYAALWFGAVGITLGYKYRYSAPVFSVCYWYLFLIDKSFWNNHSYLFGLTALLLSFTDAHCFWSIDAFHNAALAKTTVPYWNYFILKYQFFILYFMAGMKKGSAEWLTGYSVQKLAEHWVFDPFKWFLTVEQIDYLVVHWFIFLFDLTVAGWMMCARTRHVAMFFCGLFHLMNTRLFAIGMFPWVCLATMPLYYPFDWPKMILSFLHDQYLKIKDKLMQSKPKKLCDHNSLCDYETDNEDDGKGNKPHNRNETRNYEQDSRNNDDGPVKDPERVYWNSKMDKSVGNFISDYSLDEMGDDDVFINEAISANVKTAQAKVGDGSPRKDLTTYLIIAYVLLQAFLPYSHFITKGYNNWINGLYGYSWDMMVHTWDLHAVVVKVVDNENNNHLFIDPGLHTLNDRWTRHGDMLYQYAHCLRNFIVKKKKETKTQKISENISIYVDVWYSMNGRFTQRMFDPKTELVRASWTPFEKIPFLMPLLDEALYWRGVLDAIRNEVFTWSNYSDVIFLADYPGYDQERYIPLELSNVTLTVLEGRILYEPDLSKPLGQSYQLTDGDQIKPDLGAFHRVITIGNSPSYYMYTYIKITDETMDINTEKNKPKLPIFRELTLRMNKMIIFANLVFKHIFGCLSC